MATEEALIDVLPDNYDGQKLVLEELDIKSLYDIRNILTKSIEASIEADQLFDYEVLRSLLPGKYVDLIQVIDDLIVQKNQEDKIIKRVS